MPNKWCFFSSVSRSGPVRSSENKHKGKKTCNRCLLRYKLRSEFVHANVSSQPLKLGFFTALQPSSLSLRPLQLVPISWTPLSFFHSLLFPLFPLQIPNFNFDFFCSLLHAPLFTYLSVLFPFARSTDFVYSLYHSNSFTQVPNFVLTERIYFNVTFEILVPNKKIVYCLLICCKIFVANDCFLL